MRGGVPHAVDHGICAWVKEFTQIPGSVAV
jgi:hypothetical protein